MQVYVGVWEHKYGFDVEVFSSADGPEEWRQEIADEWWGREMGDDEPKPTDPREAADEYFEQNEREFFTEHGPMEVHT